MQGIAIYLLAQGIRFRVQGKKMGPSPKIRRAPYAVYPVPAYLFEELRFLLFDKLWPVFQITL